MRAAPRGEGDAPACDRAACMRAHEKCNSQSVQPAAAVCVGCLLLNPRRAAATRPVIPREALGAARGGGVVRSGGHAGEDREEIRERSATPSRARCAMPSSRLGNSASDAGGAVTSSAADRLRQRLHLCHLGGDDAFQHQLRHTVAAGNCGRCRAEKRWRGVVHAAPRALKRRTACTP